MAKLTRVKTKKVLLWLYAYGLYFLPVPWTSFWMIISIQLSIKEIIPSGLGVVLACFFGIILGVALGVFAWTKAESILKNLDSLASVAPSMKRRNWRKRASAIGSPQGGIPPHPRGVNIDRLPRK